MIDYSWDFLRTYPWRFAGYGFGMAEALRGPVAPSIVHGLYAIASGFVLARTLYKPFQISRKTQSPVKIIIWTADTFLYECLASGAVPVFFASVIKVAVSTGMKTAPFTGTTKMWAPAVTSAVLLPFIIPFTDASLDLIMNETVRQLYK